MSGGLPLFDGAKGTDFGRPPVDDRYRSMLTRMAPGLSSLAPRANAPGAILGIASGRCPVRLDEYERFRRLNVVESLYGLPIEFIGTYELRDAYRSGA